MIRMLFFLLVFMFVVCAKKVEKNTLTMAEKVIVYKSKRQLHLIKSGNIIKIYQVALGDNPLGHKQKEGDERTPEGIYTLNWRNSKSAFYKSIHISYPKTSDCVSAKKTGVSPGGNIMIHGLPKKMGWLGSMHTLKDWTNGCIAVSNEEMDEIWALVKNDVVIEIKK